MQLRAPARLDDRFDAARPIKGLEQAAFLAIEPRPRADEREKPTAQAVAAPALSGPESFPDEIFAPPRPEPAPARQQDIIALINALTQAEKIALFS